MKKILFLQPLEIYKILVKRRSNALSNFLMQHARIKNVNVAKIIMFLLVSAGRTLVMKKKSFF